MMKNKLFKSIVVVVLILTMIVPSFAIGVSATDSAVESTQGITLEEANKLIANATYLATFATHLTFRYDSLFIKEDGKIVEMPGDEWSGLVDEAQLPGGSFDGMAEFAKSIYTDDLYLSLSTEAHGFFGGDIRPDSYNFQKGEDGKIYRHLTCLSPWFTPAIDRRTYDPDTVISCIESTTDTEATVLVACDMGDNPDWPYWIECKFVKTADGWRIAKSAFTDKMAHAADMSMDGITERKQYEGDSAAPNTADASFEQIVMLTVVATLSVVAVPVVLSRKRRAEA